MSFQCSQSPLQALFRIFVLPTLSPRPTARATLSQSIQHTRHLSSTQPTYSKARGPERRTERWDQEITARQILLVDAATSRLSEHPQLTRDVLRDLDLKTHRLVQVTPDEPRNPNFTPVCRIVDKAEVARAAQRRKEAAREAKKAGARGGEDQMKTLEINWAIDANDLGHRLTRARDFLSEGRRVDVVLAAKKRGRRASPQECERVLARIRELLEEVPGAREKAGSFEGKVGGLVKWTLLGRPPASGAAAAVGKEAAREGQDGEEERGKTE